MTELELINAALNHLGQSAEVAFPPSSPEGMYCHAALATSRSEVLGETAWPFARRRTEISPDTTPPTFGYSNRFALPADLVNVVSINGEGWEQQSLYVSMEGGWLLGNFDLLQLVYTFDETDVTKWPASVANVLALRIAINCCQHVTNNAILLGNLVSRYKDAINGLPMKGQMGDAGGHQMPYLERQLRYGNHLRNGRRGTVSTGGKLFSSSSPSSSGSSLAGAIRYDSDQTSSLTPGQQATARTNMNAASLDDYATLTQNFNATKDKSDQAWNAARQASSAVDGFYVNVNNMSMRLGAVEQGLSSTETKFLRKDTPSPLTKAASEIVTGNLGMVGDPTLVAFFCGKDWQTTPKKFTTVCQRGFIKGASYVNVPSTATYDFQLEIAKLPWRDSEASMTLHVLVAPNFGASGTTNTPKFPRLNANFSGGFFTVNRSDNFANISITLTTYTGTVGASTELASNDCLSFYVTRVPTPETL